MKIEKNPPEMQALLVRVAPAKANVEHRKVFGSPCVFAGGNMFAGLHGTGLFLRLGDEARAEFLAQKGAALFEPMAGRPMREYVVAPSALLKDEKTLAKWIERSLAYAMALPPKGDKKPARTAPIKAANKPGVAAKKPAVAKRSAKTR